VPTVRLIGADGSQLGVVPTPRALQLAQSEGWDLVEIAPNATPPVAKILDFGKYRYEEQQKAKDAKKKQRAVTWKEIRMAPKIDDHDIETKIKAAARFLDEGDKLKVTVRFRGREMAHPDRGRAHLRPAPRPRRRRLLDRLRFVRQRGIAYTSRPTKAKESVSPCPSSRATAAPRSGSRSPDRARSPGPRPSRAT